jgi:elongation factor Ts
MAEISASKVKELREKTGAGMMECKKALAETQGDMEAAIDTLRKRGVAMAAKRAGRETKEGKIGSYIHAGGKIGVLLEVNCETDFVAKTDEFQELVKNIAMHIAAANPSYLVADEVPESELEKEKDIFREQARESGKPENVLENIIKGKMKKHLNEICLLDQAYVRDPDKTISQIVQEAVSKVGENLTIRRFCRFELGG